MRHNTIPKVIALLVVVQMVIITSVFAQKGHIVTTQKAQSGNQTSGNGRDFWFAIPQNYDGLDNTTKAFTAYITSDQNTTAKVTVGGGAVVDVPIEAGKVTIFPIEKSAEVTSSSAVENAKAIHIWSEDADLSTYFLSRNFYTSDGMYVIPTTGWGKEYVVASYRSLYLGVEPKGDLGDDPSEFIVVAHRDSTLVTITPTADIRNPAGTVHTKGIPFTELLNTGECAQYKCVTAKDVEGFDLTGTSVTANHSIGLIGASMCPFIPVECPYCDHILDMVPPVRTWSGTYYTTPFIGRTYGGDSYLVVASQDSQKIYRNGAFHQFIKKAKGSFFSPNIKDASVWTSDAPFMLVQYVNSATYEVPTGEERNLGDPAMVVINPAEQFRNTVTFQTPEVKQDRVVGTRDSMFKSSTEFEHFVNVILPSANVDATTYDGVPISTLANIDRLPISSTGWESIRIKDATPGTHTVVSDTGVGVYIYGYGVDESYAWSGGLGVISPMDSDDSTPDIGVNADKLTATIDVNDEGLNNIDLDGLDNMIYELDPSFIIGEGMKNTYYKLKVVDAAKPAYAAISSYDFAGNKTTTVSKYEPEGLGVDDQSNDRTYVSDQLEKGASLVLAPVSPNPASISENQTIRFTYGHSGLSPISLELYDIAGNRVATVFSSKSHAAGVYEATFNLRKDMAAGTYICRLSTGSMTRSVKLIIR